MTLDRTVNGESCGLNSNDMKRRWCNLTEAIRLDPANKSAYEAEGGALDGMGKFARADADFQKARGTGSENRRNHV